MKYFVGVHRAEVDAVYPDAAEVRRLLHPHHPLPLYRHRLHQVWKRNTRG